MMGGLVFALWPLLGCVGIQLECAVALVQALDVNVPR
jgi:hypothetical protein